MARKIRPLSAIAPHLASGHEYRASIVASLTYHSRSLAMVLSIAHLTPLVALIAGILILIVPRLLNFIVAIYLIVVGLVGLNAIYHFVK
jgi:hypothetical protein